MSLSGGTSFKDFIGGGTTGIVGLLNTLVVPVIFALAFGVFVWGVVNYFFLSGGDETKRAEGQKFVLWGLLGLVLLFSV
ncbi:MAG TPA: hypothetical protein PLW99_03160, partial [Candidatus Paceibacterota bacterium]|nr:hypothetical protein [Candidatus Paceibacterota bacterium]